jgi:DNA-binding response OmpR family regulator
MDTKKILVVDDERDALFILEKELGARGYHIIAADNGNDAIILAKTKHPDLIILDLEMPDIYGGNVTRMLGEDPATKNIPVMFLTGMFPKEKGKRGRMIAGYMLFVKPYDVEELVTAIRELLQDERVSV